jgi:hypothetical protein
VWEECVRGDDTHPTNAKGEEGWDGGNEQLLKGMDDQKPFASKIESTL